MRIEPPQKNLSWLSWYWMPERRSDWLDNDKLPLGCESLGNTHKQFRLVEFFHPPHRWGNTMLRVNTNYVHTWIIDLGWLRHDAAQCSMVGPKWFVFLPHTWDKAVLPVIPSALGSCSQLWSYRLGPFGDTRQLPGDSLRWSIFKKMISIGMFEDILEPIIGGNLGTSCHKLSYDVRIKYCIIRKGFTLVSQNWKSSKLGDDVKSK